MPNLRVFINQNNLVLAVHTSDQPDVSSAAFVNGGANTVSELSLSVEALEAGTDREKSGPGLRYLTPEAVAAGTQSLVDYASDQQNALLAQVWTFNVAASGAAPHNVTTRLDQAGAIAMLKVALWGQLNAGKSSATLPYSNVDLSSTSLTPAEAASLGSQAGDIDAKSYAILNTVAAGIAAFPATIKSTADVDAAFAKLTA